MVSLDTPERNAAFAAAHGGRVPVLSDPGKRVAQAYGVLSLGGLLAKRWTFLIDKEGLIAHIDKSVRPKTAGHDLADRLESMGVPRAES